MRPVNEHLTISKVTKLEYSHVKNLEPVLVTQTRHLRLGVPVEGDLVEGDLVEGDPVEGDPVEGVPVEGVPVEGDPVFPAVSGGNPVSLGCT